MFVGLHTNSEETENFTRTIVAWVSWTTLFCTTYIILQLYWLMINLKGIVA